MRKGNGQPVNSFVAAKKQTKFEEPTTRDSNDIEFNMISQ